MQVLLSDPENVKGLFRAGQLHLRLRNIEAAKVSSIRIPPLVLRDHIRPPVVKRVLLQEMVSRRPYRPVRH